LKTLAGHPDGNIAGGLQIRKPSQNARSGAKREENGLAAKERTDRKDLTRFFNHR
jgi:hypothetical protein